MNYRILLPVTNRPDLVAQKLKDISDLTKLIMVNNWDHPDVYKLSLEARDKGAEVYLVPKNLGLAPSWNLGIRRASEEDCDFVVIMSVSAVFDKPFECFLDAIVDQEAKGTNGTRYVADGRATLHCFAHTKKCLELGGYFDENFWPIYFEDTDFSTRSKFNGVGAGVRGNIAPGVVHSLAYSIAVNTDPRLLRMYQINAHRISDYFLRKWGGPHNQEKWDRPFNNPDTPVNYWKLEAGVTNYSIPAPI